MLDTKADKGKVAFLLGRLAVVVGGIIWAVLWISRGQRWENLAKIFLRLNLWIFAATLGIFVAAQLIIVLRWWLLLRSQSALMNFWTLVKLHFLGLFYNNFMPGSVGGDLLRAWYVTKHTDKRFKAALSVFVDRVIGLLGTLIIAVFFYLLVLQAQGDSSSFSSKDITPAPLFVHKRFLFWSAVGVAVVFFGLLLYRPGQAMLAKGWSYFTVQGLAVFKQLKDAIIVYCSSPTIILVAFGLTIVLQIVTITGFWFLGVNLGITVSIEYYYICFTLAWVLGVLPISIGGAVVVEGLLVVLFTRLTSVGAEQALALALCQRIVWMIASLPGAAIHIAGAHLPRDFSIDCRQCAN